MNQTTEAILYHLNQVEVAARTFAIPRWPGDDATFDRVIYQHLETSRKLAVLLDVQLERATPLPDPEK